MRILVVSSDVNNSLQDITKYLWDQRNTTVIPYDFNAVESFADILSLIQTQVQTMKKGTAIKSVGMMFHNNSKNSLKCFKNDTNKSTEWGEARDFALFTMFVKSLRVFYGITDFDIISCNVVQNNVGSVFKSLNIGVNINASINDTGYKGDWVLEEGRVNLIGTYFKNTIKKSGLNLQESAKDELTRLSVQNPLIGFIMGYYLNKLRLPEDKREGDKEGFPNFEVVLLDTGDISVDFGNEIKIQFNPEISSQKELKKNLVLKGELERISKVQGDKLYNIKENIWLNYDLFRRVFMRRERGEMSMQYDPCHIQKDKVLVLDKESESVDANSENESVDANSEDESLLKDPALSKFIDIHEHKLNMYGILSGLLRDNHPILNEKMGWAIKKNSKLKIYEIQQKIREVGLINFFKKTEVELKKPEVIQQFFSRHPRFGFAYGFYANLNDRCEIGEFDDSYMELYCEDQNIIIEWVKDEALGRITSYSNMVNYMVSNNKALGRITNYSNMVSNMVSNNKDNTNLDNIQTNYIAFKEIFKEDINIVNNYIKKIDQETRVVYKDISGILSQISRSDKPKIVKKLKSLLENRIKHIMTHSEIKILLMKEDGINRLLQLLDTDPTPAPAPSVRKSAPKPAKYP